MRWIVLAAALLGPGCLNLSLFPAAKPAAAPAPPPAPPAPPPVLPEQVNEANGREVADALARELQQAAAEPPASPKPADAKGSK
jgi:hypothetical protein